MHDDELAPHEREAFRALPREARPADLLEERTVRALAARGLIRSRRHLPAPLAWAAVAAACAVFFVVGFAAGQSRGSSAALRTPPGTAAAGTEGQRPIPASGVTLATTDSNRAAGTQYVVWF